MQLLRLILAVAILSAAGPAWAQEVPVQLDRPMKAGQMFQLSAKFQQVESSSVGGSRGSITVAVTLTAFVSVAEVDAKGGITKATYRVVEFKAARDYAGMKRPPAGPAPLRKVSLPKDYTFEASAQRDGVKFDSQMLDVLHPDTADYLKLVVLLKGGENLGFDPAYGTADKQKPGGSWAVNAESLTRTLKAIRMPVIRGTVKGRTTLRSSTPGPDGSQHVRSEVTFNADGGPGQLLMETHVPTDAARLPLDRTVTAQHSVEGRAAGGAIARSQNRITLAYTFK